METDINKSNEILKECIGILLFKNSFWGFVFSKIKRVCDETLPAIMGVSMSDDSLISLYYNPRYVIHANRDFLIKVFEHEGIHILNNHLGLLLLILSNEPNKERKKEKMDLFGVAADFAANSLIYDMPKSQTIDGELMEFCFPENYNLPMKQAVEYYFSELLKNEEKDKNNKSQKDKSSSEKFNSLNDSNDSNNGNGDKQKYSLDDHSKWTSELKDCPDLRSLARKIEKQSKEIIIDAYNTMDAKSRGTLPTYIQQVITQFFLKPKVPYYHIISKLIKGSKISKSKIAYNRINRKRSYLISERNEENFPLLSPFPGKTKDATFKICIILDTSGSMNSEDIRQGLSGAKNIIEQDKDCLTTIIEIDAKIHKIYNIKKINDIDFNVLGRGGTYLTPALEYAKKNNYDVALIFTDGWCENLQNVDRKKLPNKMIWVITPGGAITNINGIGFIIRLDADKNVLNE